MTESLPEGASFGGRDENRDGGSWNNGCEARMARINQELATRRQQRERREQASNSAAGSQQEGANTCMCDSSARAGDDGPPCRHNPHESLFPQQGAMRRDGDGQPHPKIRRIDDDAGRGGRGRRDDAMQLEEQQQDVTSTQGQAAGGNQGDVTMHAATSDVDAEDDPHAAILRNHCDKVAQEALAVLDNKLPQGVQSAATVRYYDTRGGLCQRYYVRRANSTGLGQELYDAGAARAQQ